MGNPDRIVDQTVGNRLVLDNVRSAMSMIVSRIDTSGNVFVTCEYLDGAIHEHGPLPNKFTLSVGDEVLVVMDQYDSWWLVGTR